MKKRGKFKYDKNIVLDKDSFMELEAFLRKYCISVKYDVTTWNEDSIEFDTNEELFKHDNFKKGKIKELELSGYNRHDRIFTLKLLGKRHSAPYVECKYSFDNVDTETSFIAGLTRFFDKNTECYHQHLITSLLIALALLAGSCYFSFRYELIHTGAMWAVMFFTVLLYYFVENKILKYLFPPVVFLWGMEIKKHKTRTAVRNNIFWCIFVAIGLAWLMEVIFP